MAEHTFTVTVSGCSAEEARQVMAERIYHDEDYGFDYQIGFTSGPLPCDYREEFPDSDHTCDTDACCECGGNHCCGSSMCPVSCPPEEESPPTDHPDDFETFKRRVEKGTRVE